MYTEYYQLTRPPFDNTPDPRFLYLSKQHKEILASLLYGVKSAKGFILVGGDVGTGKTTLIHTLLNIIERDNFVIHIVNPRIDFNDILRYLAKKIGIKEEEKSTIELIEHIGEKLEHLDEIGKRTVLIIDEAHLLSKDSLEDIRLLSNLETKKRKLIQIVLVGQNEIYDELQDDSLRSLKQRILINRKLEPLNQRGTRRYIKHRLKVAGTNNSLFNKGALSQIWKSSKGIPRIINHICDNALLIGLAEEKQIIGARIIKEVVMDMETGRERPRFIIRPLYLRFKWVVGFAVIVLSILIGVNLISNRPSKNKVISDELPDMAVTTSAQNESPKDPDTKISGETSTAPNDISRQASVVPHNIPSDRNSLNPEIEGEHGGKKNQTKNHSSAAPIGELPDMAVTTERVKLKLPSISNLTNERIRKGNGLNKKQKKVKPKEYLSKIVLEEYGIANDTVMDIIQTANPDIKNLNLIFINQRIRLPQITRKDLIVKNHTGTFYIHYASHYNFQDAQKTVEDLLNNELTSFIVPSTQGEHLVYRVYCGIFHSRIEAEEKIETLKLKYLPFLNNRP